jgi:cobalt-zinc-cadmium efflux system protein
MTHDDKHEMHTHKHEHEYGHNHSHRHNVTEGNEYRLRFVFLLTFGYAIIQAAGGWLSGSLALIADSGHMISDAAALLLALIAYRIARRPANNSKTYGYHRVRVLAALANGVALLLLVVWIIWEAIQRILSPSAVLAGPMLVIAIVGLIINLASTWILVPGNKNDGNFEGVFLHVVSDLLGSIGAIAAAVGIMLTGWAILDPILSVLVALLVVRSAWKLVMNSINILLQAVPRNIDSQIAERSVSAMEQVSEAGHFHAWTLTDDTVIATIHVTPSEGVHPLSLPALVSEKLISEFGINHITVQVDPPGQLSRKGL